VAQFYENHRAGLMALCEMGFASADSVGRSSRAAGSSVRMPRSVNTSGGNIGEAYIHGFEMINESVRQIRGDSTCQVERVECALVVAGPGYCPGSAVLFGAPE
jgi:hypothetical protein